MTRYLVSFSRLPIISLEAFFRSQIVFFNIDQMLSLSRSLFSLQNVFDLLFFFARTKIDVRRRSIDSIK